MDIKREVEGLLSKEYNSLDEKEIITKFCKSLNDSNNTLLEANYFAYHSYQRNCVNHNEESFNTVQRIYNTLKNRK